MFLVIRWVWPEEGETPPLLSTQRPQSWPGTLRHNFHLGKIVFFRAPAGKYGLDLKGALFLGGLPHFPKLLPYKSGFKGETQHDRNWGGEHNGYRLLGLSEGWWARDICSLPWGCRHHQVKNGLAMQKQLRWIVALEHFSLDSKENWNVRKQKLNI